MSRKVCVRVCFFGAAAVSLLAVTPPAAAIDFTWDGEVNTAWTGQGTGGGFTPIPTNWDVELLGFTFFPDAFDRVLFPSTASTPVRRTVDLGGFRAVQEAVFSGNVSPGVTLTNGLLQLENGDLSASGSASHVLEVEVRPQAAAEWDLDDTSEITLAGGMLMLGTSSFTKTGTGTLINTDTWTGFSLLDLQEGGIRATGGSSLMQANSGAGVVVGNAAGLGAQLTLTDNARLQWGSPGTIDVIANGSLNVTNGASLLNTRTATPQDGADGATGGSIAVSNSALFLNATGSFRGGDGGSGNSFVEDGDGGGGGTATLNPASTFTVIDGAGLSFAGGDGGDDLFLRNPGPDGFDAAGRGGDGGTVTNDATTFTLRGFGSIVDLRGGDGGDQFQGSSTRRGGDGGNGGGFDSSSASFSITDNATLELSGGHAGVPIASVVSHASGGHGGHGGRLDLMAGALFMDTNGTIRLDGGDGSDGVANFITANTGGDGGDGGTLALTGGFFTLGGGTVSLVGGKAGNGAGSFGTDGTDGAHGTVDLTAGSLVMTNGTLRAGTMQTSGTGAFGFTGGTLTLEQYDGHLNQDGGTLAPGDFYGPGGTGTTDVNGDYALNTGTLAIDIAGNVAGGEYDRVLADSAGLGAGSVLDVTLINGFVPALGDTFTVLSTTGGVTGTFGGFVGGIGNVGSSIGWTVQYLADAVVLEATLGGDYNADGSVDQGDLDLVLLNWGDDASATGVPSGWVNIQPTGLIGQTELDGVLLNWGNTAEAGAASVPEPSAGLVALTPGLAVRRRRA